MINKLDFFHWHQLWVCILDMRWHFLKLATRFRIVFLDWSPMVDPNSLRHSTQYTLFTSTKNLSKDLKCHWWSFRVVDVISFISLSLVDKYLVIAATLIDVDFKLDATCVSIFTTNSKTTMWRQLLVWVVERGKIGVRSWIQTSSTLSSRVCWELETKSRPTTSMFFFDSRLRWTSGK